MSVVVVLRLPLIVVVVPVPLGPSTTERGEPEGLLVVLVVLARPVHEREWWTVDDTSGRSTTSTARSVDRGGGFAGRISAQIDTSTRRQGSLALALTRNAVQ